MRLTLFILFFFLALHAIKSQENFLDNFLLEDKLTAENQLEQFQDYDFSQLWMKTENHLVVGIIGKNHHRIQIKLLSIIKSDDTPRLYQVHGMWRINNILCSFQGTIDLTEIRTVEELHFGVDQTYADSSIQSQGIVIAEYNFKDENCEDLGYLQGTLYTKWYLAQDSLKYDDIQFMSDEYSNNAFIGYRIDHKSGLRQTCNWGDYRVPLACRDFDVGAGEFSPAEKYSPFGWESYRKAWLDGDKNALKEEMSPWWELVK